jgi:glycosyltransferase involved in cell wall biosynthesis
MVVIPVTVPRYDFEADSIADSLDQVADGSQGSARLEARQVIVYKSEYCRNSLGSLRTVKCKYTGHINLPTMKPIRRIVWVLPHPTPYNIYLLNTLQDRLGIPMDCVYRYASLPSHPWTSLPARTFLHRTIVNPGGRDRQLEAIAGSDESALLIFAGWRDRTIFPALLNRRRRRLPHAFWSDTPKTGNGLARKVVNRMQVFFASRAVGFLATGQPAIEAYARMGIPSAKLVNFPFVVDPVHFAKATGIRSQAGSPLTFVLPARLVDSLKGQRVAIDALSEAQTALPDSVLKLVITGVGPDEQMLKQYAARSAVAKQIEFRGWTDYGEMPRLLGSAHALILPSRWDPYPVAVIEAMAAGLPVLGSSACGSAREMVRNGENGFIHDAGDSSQLAAHMVKLAGSPELLARLSRNALATSREWGAERAAAAVRELIDAAEQS